MTMIGMIMIVIKIIRGEARSINNPTTANMPTTCDYNDKDDYDNDGDQLPEQLNITKMPTTFDNNVTLTFILMIMIMK